MILQSLLLLLLAAPSASGPSPAGPQEARLVEEMFGKQIAQAMATQEPQDNVEVAGEMLKAAEDASNPAAFRLALAPQILRVLANVLTPEASRIIHSTLTMQQKLQPVDSMQETQAELDLFANRYALARRLQVDPAIALQAGREVVLLSLQLSKLQMEEGKFEAAATTLAAARKTARTAKLTQEDLQIEEALQLLAAQKTRAGRLAAMQQKLAIAKQSGDAEAMRVAQVQLGLFYLLNDGELKKAAAELAGTSHAYGAPLDALNDFLDRPQSPPPPEVCNSIADAVVEMAKAAENAKAQAVIATAGQQLCQASIAQNPQGLATAKTKLLLMQLEKLTAESASDKLTRILKTNYGSFEGKLEKSATGDGVIITYDLSSPRQLADWETRVGKWEITAGKLLSVPGSGQARINSRLKFRGDQPASLTFQATGKQDFDAAFSFRAEGGEHSAEFRFANFDPRDHVMRHISVVDGKPQSVVRETIDPAQSYRITITWDGQGNFSWSANGKDIAKISVPPEFSQRPLRMCLINVQQPMTIKDLKLEGTVIENPDEAALPAATSTQPASAPAKTAQ
jgi:hypothetical protein